jgi:hypothetical protein
MYVTVSAQQCESDFLFESYLLTFAPGQREGARFALTGYPDWGRDEYGRSIDERHFIENQTRVHDPRWNDGEPSLAGTTISYAGYRYAVFARRINAGTAPQEDSARRHTVFYA